MNAGLTPGIPPFETLDHPPRPIPQPESPTPNQPSSHTPERVRLLIAIYCRDHTNLLSRLL